MICWGGALEAGTGIPPEEPGLDTVLLSIGGVVLIGPVEIGVTPLLEET